MTGGHLARALDAYFDNPLLHQHPSNFVEILDESEITVPPSPPYSDEEDDWVIMTGSDFSARPASKRAIERLVKFEVKASHLPNKEEVAKESNEKDDDEAKGGDKDKNTKVIESA